jgi:serine/threonine protein kinase
MKDLKKKYQISSEFIEFINNLLNHDPNKRSAVCDILELPWIKLERLTKNDFFEFFQEVKILYEKSENLQEFQKTLKSKYRDFVE